MKSYFRALTIAGSDSGGGAGIQADLKTFSALGCFGMSAITALTAQNTSVVKSIFPVSPEFIGEQIDAVMEDIGADAVKTGMLYSPEVIEIVTKKLIQWNCSNIVLDPVMISKSGDKLLQSDAIQALKEILIPRVLLVTPNLPEASVLLNRKIETIDDMGDGARDLAALGCANVLLKGGHLTSENNCDFLYQKNTDTLTKIPGTHINTKNSHGTGCTLSSAVCANLARGVPLAAAVMNAKNYITEALKEGAKYTTGKGCGPVNHFYNFWRDN